MDQRSQMRALFVLAGIALIVTGLNNSGPLVIAGVVLILLAFLGRWVGEGRSR